ncbi:MAG TPA: hypothetical protein K8W15_01390 [Gallibacterium anatis]|uniref:Uncharacterized protein n=1 Tax=Gallibacterium anatis TaxID=750 RepID=A0A921HA05_9PAST|nr:hypothetical protein [Gallibacterium anatis]
MITEKLTLANGTVVEFFTTDLEQMRSLFPGYDYFKAMKEERKQKREIAKKRKKRLQQQKQARRKARGK